MSAFDSEPFDAFDPIPRVRRPRRRRQSFGVVMTLVVLAFALAAAGIVALNGGFDPQKVIDKLSVGKKTVPLSGELFVTTQAGDVKKAAGLTIHLTPVTPDLRTSFITIFNSLVKAQGMHKSSVDHSKEMSDLQDELAVERETLDVAKTRMHIATGGGGGEKEITEVQNIENKVLDLTTKLADKMRAQAKVDYDKEIAASTSADRSEPFKASLESVIAKGSKVLVADGDGKFSLDIPPGRYILWTDEFSIFREHIKWCKGIQVDDAPEHLVLDKQTALFGEHLYKGMRDEHGGDVILDIPFYDFLSRFAVELDKSK